jgi:hypothetical protein
MVDQEDADTTHERVDRIQETWLAEQARLVLLEDGN